MSSVSLRKLLNKPIRGQKPPRKPPQRLFKVNLKFVIEPEEKRRDYVQVLERMIGRVGKIFNARKTDIEQRLRAMTVLSDLIKTSYTMVRDVDVKRLERQVVELEEKDRQAPEGKGSSE